jgi:heat shock protein HslJ
MLDAGCWMLDAELEMQFMKQFLLLLQFVGVLGLTCLNAQAPGKQVPDSARLYGEWFLQPVLASDTATGHLPNISFDLSKRKFKGFTGCNQMSGSFRLSGDALSFDKDIVLTRVACEGFNEKDFIVNLLRVTHYRFKDGVLILQIDNTPVSKWLRKADSGIVASDPGPR